MSDTDTPIACTLDAASYPKRLADIRALMTRALKSARREGASLHLAFDPAARADVEDMVRKEQACCAFLDFQTTQANGEIALTITVPPRAADSADDLLAPFAPKPVSGLSGLLARAGLGAGGATLLCGAGCAAALALGVPFLCF